LVADTHTYTHTHIYMYIVVKTEMRQDVGLLGRYMWSLVADEHIYIFIYLYIVI